MIKDSEIAFCSTWISVLNSFPCSPSPGKFFLSFDSDQGRPGLTHDKKSHGVFGWKLEPAGLWRRMSGDQTDSHGSRLCVTFPYLWWIFDPRVIQKLFFSVKSHSLLGIPGKEDVVPLGDHLTVGRESLRMHSLRMHKFMKLGENLGFTLLMHKIKSTCSFSSRSTML